jgi:hypothetical protein
LTALWFRLVTWASGVLSDQRKRPRTGMIPEPLPSRVLGFSAGTVARGIRLDKEPFVT